MLKKTQNKVVCENWETCGVAFCGHNSPHVKDNSCHSTCTFVGGKTTCKEVTSEDPFNFESNFIPIRKRIMINEFIAEEEMTL